jgi:hypothetical protein
MWHEALIAQQSPYFYNMWQNTYHYRPTKLTVWSKNGSAMLKQHFFMSRVKYFGKKYNSQFLNIEPEILANVTKSRSRSRLGQWRINEICAGTRVSGTKMFVLVSSITWLSSLTHLLNVLDKNDGKPIFIRSYSLHLAAVLRTSNFQKGPVMCRFRSTAEIFLSLSTLYHIVWPPTQEHNVFYSSTALPPSCSSTDLRGLY